MSREYLAYGLLGLALWPVPLLNVLQVESAAVVAFASFFVGGWAATHQFQRGRASFLGVLGRREVALLVPLGMLTVAQLWAPNCTFGQGLLFFALFPGVTVVFAVACSYLVTGTDVSSPFLWLAAGGLLLSLLGPIYDLGFHPQFYTYNHVFGGVLGPIYDEQLAVRSGLFVFRGLTLLWAGGAVAGGRLLRGYGGWVPLLVCGVTIGIMYAWAVPLGLNTSAEQLQRRLGGHVRTAHVDLYYDPERLGPRAVAALADDHEAYYRYLQERLNLAPGAGPGRIQSYLYPSPDVKAQLTGARYTSVSPVWLGTPQVHLLTRRAEESLGHELAHVFSRPYGLPGINASWSPGLVEGWAVALEPPSPAPPTHDLVRVATTTDTSAALSLTAEALTGRLSPWGFWTGRGAVSYATMGSFVDHLLDEHGADRLKRVYARGNFADVYGRPLDVLAQNWADSLARRPLVARAAHAVVARQFTRPSLFETNCPHYVPPHRRQLQAAREARRAGDTTAVGQHLRRAVAAAPRSLTAQAALARYRLGRGRAGAVRRQLDTLAARRWPAALRRLRADARAIGGDSAAARDGYRAALRRLPLSAHDRRGRVLMRVAVAGRPAVVRTLTSGDSAVHQARALRALPDRSGAVRVWRALRLQDAHRYAAADTLWRRESFDPPAAWARARRQALALQQRMWSGIAAHRADRFAAAAATLATAARRAAAHGAPAWAETLRFWVRRARWASPPGRAVN
ncbi:MAG: hypothetical protein ABEL97_15030 [Salinibacter sp.]